MEFNLNACFNLRFWTVLDKASWAVSLYSDIIVDAIEYSLVKKKVHQKLYFINKTEYFDMMRKQLSSTDETSVEILKLVSNASYREKKRYYFCIRMLVLMQNFNVD